MSDLTNFEEYLKENGKLTYTFKGVSMNPLLKQGRDLVTLVPKTEKRCKKYDVVLYRRDEKHYVLHRVIEVRGNDYVIQGDNCFAKEYGIRDEDIIGILSYFMRKGKMVKVTDFSYRMYSYIWVAVHPTVIFSKRIVRKLARKIRR